MAVCGRCWFCGTKFSCTLKDVGAVVLKLGVLDNSLESLPSDLNDEGRKLCTSCVDAIDGNLFIGKPNEPHGDGMPEPDRIALLIKALVLVADDRKQR